MKNIFGMRIACEKASYSMRNVSDRNFYYCSFDNGKYYLWLNLNNKIGNCPYAFGFDKYADYFGDKGEKDSESWSIDLEPTKSLNEFYKIAKLIKTSKLKTKKDFVRLLKNYLEKDLFFPSSGPNTNKYYANAKFKRCGVAYITDFKVICPCTLCAEDRFSNVNNYNYAAKELLAFSNGTLF